MQSLIKHLHSFVREIEPTEAEWATAIDWLTRTGQMCSEKRQEFIMASDVLGVSMLVDAINHRQPGKATPSTVEGPFHVPNAPSMANGGNMAEGCPGIPCFVSGTVRSLNGEPVGGAVLDLWQADGEGLYEDQRHTRGPWMRGLYHSQPDGSYAVRTVAPIGRPDGRHRGRADESRQDQPYAAGPHPFRHCCTGLPRLRHPSVSEGRRVHRE
jgi:hydroxyquinol 1,2-dioxygenase